MINFIKMYLRNRISYKITIDKYVDDIFTDRLSVHTIEFGDSITIETGKVKFV